MLSLTSADTGTLMISLMRPGPGHWEKLGEIETERQKGRGREDYEKVVKVCDCSPDCLMLH